MSTPPKHPNPPSLTPQSAATVSVRLYPKELAWLDQQKRVGESRAMALKRLAGIPAGLHWQL